MSAKNLVIVGNGMVGHRLIEELLAREHGWNIVCFGEEPRLAYDRVHLSRWFRDRDPSSLAIADADTYRDGGVLTHLGDRVERIERPGKRVFATSGRSVAYDALVLATGSRPFVPPVPGADGDGCFVYRTVEDLEAIGAWSRTASRGVVVGGGLLGLEAAGALRQLGLDTHVVELASHLMAVQVDADGGAILRSLIEDTHGVRVLTSARTVAIEQDRGRVARLRFDDDSTLDTDMVVFSAGIRPRDELARAAGLTVGPRGGVAIDDRCRTDDPDIFAVGECAAHNHQVYGLVAPGYAMARVVADQLAGSGTERFSGVDLSTKLKLLGVDVASFGDAHGRTEGSRSYALRDELGQRYAKIVVDPGEGRLLGGVLVGDTDASYDHLVAMMRGGLSVPERAEELLFGSGAGVAALPDSAQICSCNDVCKVALCSAVDSGAHDVATLTAKTNAGTGCGGCVPAVKELLAARLVELGVEVNTDLCEHFPHSRRELYDIVRACRVRTFEQLRDRCGRGRGCEICKPAVASILAACWNEHIMDEPHAGLQDTNDYFLANMQRNGSYSVVPRVPGGEITPDQLIAIGTIAKKYDLYSKITGGQRIDLFGAQLDQLPEIWRELIDAGLESGHAYGKALRTVKSCVGSTWCRYGVQDSLGLAIRLEHRYKGLRAPHKLKMAVSGCTRECAEAQSKDIGVIATENGYNLYVAGNGGSRPRHADLFATDLDEATLVAYIDRFLMFYIRTADRLQRTARWLESLDGGLDYVRQVVIDDRLGIAAELEREMAHVVGTYRCEWKAAIADSRKLRRFRTFVNDDGRDPSLSYARERGQKRPILSKGATR